MVTEAFVGSSKRYHKQKKLDRHIHAKANREVLELLQAQCIRGSGACPLVSTLSEIFAHLKGGPDIHFEMEAFVSCDEIS